MPRGNKNFGKEVKSPGRPRNLENMAQAKVYREDVLRDKLPVLLDVMVDDATRRKNPKTAQALVEMLFGKPAEPKTDRNDALHIFLHGLAQAVRGEIIEGTMKELSSGPETDPGTDTD